MSFLKIRCLALAVALLQVVPGSLAESQRTVLRPAEIAKARQEATKALKVIVVLWLSGQLMNSLDDEAPWESNPLLDLLPKPPGGITHPDLFPETLPDLLDMITRHVRDFGVGKEPPTEVYRIELDELRQWKKKSTDTADPMTLLGETEQLIFPVFLLEREEPLAFITVGKFEGAWRLASITVWDPTPELEKAMEKAMEDHEFAYMIEVPAMYQRFMAYDPLSGDAPGTTTAGEIAHDQELMSSSTLLIEAVEDERIEEATNGELGEEGTLLPIARAFDLLWELSQKWEGALARTRE